MEVYAVRFLKHCGLDLQNLIFQILSRLNGSETSLGWYGFEIYRPWHKGFGRPFQP